MSPLCRSVVKITVPWAVGKSTWSCWPRLRGNSRSRERGRKGKKRRDGGWSLCSRRREISVCSWSKKTRVRHHTARRHRTSRCVSCSVRNERFLSMGVSSGPVSPPVPLPRKKKPQPRPRAILAAIALAPHLAPVPRPRSKHFEVRVYVYTLQCTILGSWHLSLKCDWVCIVIPPPRQDIWQVLDNFTSQ